MISANPKSSMMLSVRISSLTMTRQRHVRTASKWLFFFSLAMLMVPQALQNHAVVVAVLAVAGDMTKTKTKMQGLVVPLRKPVGSASRWAEHINVNKFHRYG